MLAVTAAGCDLVILVSQPLFLAFDCWLLLANVMMSLVGDADKDNNNDTNNEVGVAMLCRHGASDVFRRSRQIKYRLSARRYGMVESRHL